MSCEAWKLFWFKALLLKIQAKILNSKQENDYELKFISDCAIVRGCFHHHKCSSLFKSVFIVDWIKNSILSEAHFLIHHARRAAEVANVLGILLDFLFQNHVWEFNQKPFFRKLLSIHQIMEEKTCKNMCKAARDCVSVNYHEHRQKKT